MIDLYFYIGSGLAILVMLISMQNNELAFYKIFWAAVVTVLFWPYTLFKIFKGIKWKQK
mgnify:CR=1 FL=1|jgi:hypothetical protein